VVVELPDPGQDGAAADRRDALVGEVTDRGREVLLETDRLIVVAR